MLLLSLSVLYILAEINFVLIWILFVGLKFITIPRDQIDRNFLYI